MAWESSKENVQPISSGRKVSFLEAAFQPSEQDMQHLLQERQKFEEEILAGENSQDPIDAWDRYLKWARQHFPIGENRKNFENLLQKYIVKFLKHEQYRNDPRYVDSWLTMAQISDNPLNSFSYMKTEGIGTSCASFYVAWAEEYEKYRHFKKAAAIYEYGEQNNAQPAAFLSQMKSAFELRTARASVAGIQHNEDDDSSEIFNPPAMVNERKALGRLQGRGSTKTVGSVRKPDQNTTLPLKSTKSQNNMGSSGTKKFRFYSDDENQKPAVGKTGKWAEMPKSDILNKENLLQEPTPWKDKKVAQRMVSRSPHPTHSTFTIFQDSAMDGSPDESSVHPSTRKVSRNVEHFLAERKVQTNEESSLHKAIRESYGDQNTNTVCMYPVDKVYSVMGEFQLEEVIAARWRRKMREKKEEEERLEKEYLHKRQAEECEEYKRQNEEMKNQVKAKEEELIRKQNQLKKVLELCKMKLGDDDNQSGSLSRESEEITVKLENVCGQLKTLRMNKPKQTFLEAADYGRPRSNEESIKEFPLPPMDDSSSTRDGVSANSSCNLSRRAQPSPTVCTKEALGNIMDMFKQPLSQTSLFSDLMQDPSVDKAKSFEVFCDESVNVPAPNVNGYDKENEDSHKDRLDKTKPKADLTKTPFGLHDRESLKIPQKTVAGSNLRDVETHPTFLGDVSIARGHNGEFADGDLSAFSTFCPNQDESMQAGFVPSAKMLAESTSLWPAADMKTPFVCADPPLGDADAGESSPQNIKKLSPILEASDESDKSVATKSQIHCESLPPTKSFIRPPTVGRKRFADVSAVTYQEDSSIQFLPSTSICGNKDSMKPAFSIFADEDKNCSTITNNGCNSSKLAPSDFAMDKSLSLQPVTLQPSSPSHFNVFADVSMDSKENASMLFRSGLRNLDDSEIKPVDLMQPSAIDSVLSPCVSMLGNEGTDDGASSHSATFPSQRDHQEQEMDHLRDDRLSNIDGLCSEMMETSLSELDRNKDLQLEPVLELSSSSDESFHVLPSNDNFSFAKEDVNFAHSNDVSMMQQLNDSFQSASLQFAQGDMSPERRNSSSQLQIIRDPWTDDILQHVMESYRHQPNNITRVHRNMPRLQKSRTCTLGMKSYSIIDVVGKGAFAKVHRAEDDHNNTYAIKVQSPSYVWEVYILEEAKRRLKSKVANFNDDVLMDIDHAIIYDDTSCLVCDFIPHGTLLDYLNYMHEMKKTPPYLEIALAILTVVNHLHSVDIIHGDIKPDNFLVCSDYRSSEGKLKLKLIDFGRGIDMRSFPPGTAFTRDCGTEGFVCGQMKLKQPWSYHTDYYGVAGSLHVMLNRSYMGTIQDRDGRWKITGRLPRWAGKSWTNLFDTLLNFPTPSDTWWPSYKDSPLPSLVNSLTSL